MSNIPLRSLEVAFGVNPYSAVTDAQFTYIGGDVTSLNPAATNGIVRSVSIRRGKQPQINKFEPGQFTAILDNRDGRFDPANTSGPYFNQLLPSAGVRLRVWVNRMLANQSLGVNSAGIFNDLINCTMATGIISSPAVRLPGTSDIQITATGAGTMSFVARSTTDAPAGGQPATPWDDSKGYPVTEGEWYTATASYQTAVTARTCTTAIQWRNSAGTILSTITSTGVTDTAGSWHDDSIFGQAPAGSSYATVKFTVASAAGSEIHYIGAPAFWAGADTNRSYDNLSCVGVPLFTGFADGWQCDYTNPNEATCTLTASDAFMLFQVRPFRDAYAMEVLKTNPSFYWRLNEAAGATAVSDAIGTNPPGKVSVFNVTFGLASVINTGATANANAIVSATNTSAAFGVSNITAGVGSITQTGLGGGLSGLPPFSIMFWVNVNSGVMATKPGNFICTVLYQNSPNAPGAPIPGSSMWDLEINYTASFPNQGDLRLVMFDINGNVSQTGIPFASALNPAKFICDGLWHHIAITMSAAGVVKSYIDNVFQTSVTITPRSQTLNPITVAAKGPSFPMADGFPGSLDEVVIWNNADISTGTAIGDIVNPIPTRFSFVPATPYPVPVGNQTVDAVLNALLSEAGWAGSTFIPSASTVLCPLDDMEGATLMDIMNKVVDTNVGYLFMNASGSVIFIDRQAPLIYNPTVTFSDVNDVNYNVTNIPYSTIQTQMDSIYVQNHITLTRHGGGIGEAIDTASVAKYGDKKLPKATYDATDAVLQDEANWILSHNANPQIRLPYMDIILENSPALMGSILKRELIDMVKILRTGPGVSTVTYQPLIHGIEHTISPADWKVKWYFDLVDSPGTNPYFILNDTVRGVLNTSRLGF